MQAHPGAGESRLIWRLCLFVHIMPQSTQRQLRRWRQPSRRLLPWLSRVSGIARICWWVQPRHAAVVALEGHLSAAHLRQCRYGGPPEQYGGQPDAFGGPPVEGGPPQGTPEYAEWAAQVTIKTGQCMTPAPRTSWDLKPRKRFNVTCLDVTGMNRDALLLWRCRATQCRVRGSG